MYILSVVPLTKISLPSSQFLTYFYRQDIAVGAIVQIVLKNRKVLAIVLKSEKLTPSKKQELKKIASFALKKINKVLTKNPVLYPFQIKWAKEIAKYYYEPLGTCLNLFLPKKILKKANFKDLEIKYDNEINVTQEKIYFKKYNYNLNSILTKIKKTNGVILFVTADLIALENWVKFFNNKISNINIIHSKLPPKIYLKTWLNIKKQTHGLIIGTKSALWSLNINTKLIIIDNCNSVYYQSWKQHPRYDTIQAVKILHQITKIKTILLDNVISLNNYYEIKEGKISFLNKLPEKISLNPSLFINLKRHYNVNNHNNTQNIFNQKLIDILTKIIKNKQRAILYINKKGYAKIIFCRSCGFILKCPNCQISFNYYTIATDNNIQPPFLLCQSCGKIEQPPDFCLKCKSYDFIYFQLGEDFIIKELQKKFQNIKIFKFDSDTAPKIKDQKKILNEFYSSSPAFLVGTSLISKIRPDFNIKADCAIALNIDYDLFFPNYFSQEKTLLSLIHLQNISNSLVVQSYQDKIEDLIFEKELATRKLLGYPPFYKIVKITILPKKTYNTLSQAKMLFNFLSDMTQKMIKHYKLNEKSLTIQGPIPSLLKEKIIYLIIIKFSDLAFQYKNKLLQLIPIKVDIDVQPKNIF